MEQNKLDLPFELFLYGQPISKFDIFQLVEITKKVKQKSTNNCLVGYMLHLLGDDTELARVVGYDNSSLDLIKLNLN